MKLTELRGPAQAGTGMLLVGTLVAVSADIATYPVFGAQALRYALAAVVLIAVLATRRAARIRLTIPELGLLIALAAAGLAIFNICIVAATSHISAALIGVILGAAPVVMAIVGPIVARTGRPSPQVVLAAIAVTIGTAVAGGFGGGSLTGILLAIAALAGEVAFSLLAVPLLPKLGALRVSAYSAALSVPLLLAAGFVTDGTAVLRMPTVGEAVGIGYLGLVVTAVAFLLWYDALPRLGADRAGLFAGLMPIGAVATMMLLGQGIPKPAELLGATIVVAAIGFGLRRTRASRPVQPVAVTGSHSRAM